MQKKQIKQKITQETKEQLFKEFKNDTNKDKLDFKKYQKQFNISHNLIKKYYQKYLNEQKAEQTKYRQDPKKLTQQEKQQISEYIKNNQNATKEEIQKLIPNKIITSNIIKAIKHPLWSQEDDEKLKELFNKYQNNQTLNWYQQQFNNKQKMFVESQLSFLCKDKRNLMPKKKQFWTKDKLDMIKQCNNEEDAIQQIQKLNLDVDKYRGEFIKKYQQLKVQKEQNLKDNIKKILNK